MFTKHVTLALAAIGTQAIKLGTVAQGGAEADAELARGIRHCMLHPTHPLC